jgi:hypothetical protein
VELDKLILADESSTKNQIINILKATFVPSQERIAQFQPYVLIVSFLFLLSSIITCLARRSELTGISLTIVSAFIFYIVGILCIQARPSREDSGITSTTKRTAVRRSSDSGSGISLGEFNPIHTTETKPSKGLHGIDFIAS